MIRLKNILESLNNESVDLVVDKYSNRMSSYIDNTIKTYEIDNPIVSSTIDSAVSTFKDKLSARVNLNIDRLNRLQTKNYTKTLADTWNLILINSLKQTVQAELSAAKKTLIRSLMSKEELLKAWDRRVAREVKKFLAYWGMEVQIAYRPAEWKTGNHVREYMGKSHDTMQEEIKQYIVNYIYG